MILRMMIKNFRTFVSFSVVEFWFPCWNSSFPLFIGISSFLSISCSFAIVLAWKVIFWFDICSLVDDRLYTRRSSVSHTSLGCLFDVVAIPLYNHRMIHLSLRIKMTENKIATFKNMAQVGKCFTNWPSNENCETPLNIGTFIFTLLGIFGILFSCSVFIFCTFVRCKKKQPMVYQTRSGTLTRRPLI